MSSSKLAWVLGLQLAAGAALLACGGEDGGGDDDGNTGETGGDGGTSGGTLQFRNAALYSAFVEGKESLVPVRLRDPSLAGKGAKFTSSDTSVATVVDDDKGAMITVKKDGTATINVSLNGETGSTKLTVTKFTEAQWQTGQGRYSKSELALKSPSGGAVSALLLTDPNNRVPTGACTTCHTAQAQALKVENTPTQIAGYSDEQLITIFTMGKKPEGAAQQSMVPEFAWGRFHSWTVTEEEKLGLVAYLRTQTPKDNPSMIDYGVKACPGSPTTASGFPTQFCDNNGNPIGRRDGGTPRPDAGGGTGDTDAGVTTDDAGSTTDTDAGTTDTDAGTTDTDAG